MKRIRMNRLEDGEQREDVLTTMFSPRELRRREQLTDPDSPVDVRVVAQQVRGHLTNVVCRHIETD